MLRSAFLLLFLITMRCSAQPVFFESVFGTDFFDYARSVKQLSSGSIFVTGFSQNGPNGGTDVTLYKLDRYGNMLWAKFYGDSLNESAFYLALASDGNLLICGEQQTGTNALDGFLLKTDTLGNLVWMRQYGDSTNQSLRFVSEAANGDYLLAGFTNDSFSSNDHLLLRTDSAGILRWSRNYGGTNNDYADAVRELPGGDLLLSGDTRSWGFGGYDVEMIRTDSAGNVSWDQVFGDSLQNGCQGFLLSSDMHVVSFGETEIAPLSYFDFFLEKMDTAGNSLWRQTFGGLQADAAFSATEVQDGFMLCGYSNSYAQGPISVVVLKTDTAGNLLWAHPYGGPGIDIGYEIIPSLYNGFLVIGTSNVSGDDQCYLLHTDAGGWTGTAPQENETKHPFIYPNPSAGLFSLGFPGTRQNARLRVFAADGTLAAETAAAGSIDLRGKLAPGFYIAEVTTGNTRMATPLVITD